MQTNSGDKIASIAGRALPSASIAGRTVGYLYRVGFLDPLVTDFLATLTVHEELKFRAPPRTIGKYVFEHHVAFCLLCCLWAVAMDALAHVPGVPVVPALQNLSVKQNRINAGKVRSVRPVEDQRTPSMTMRSVR